MLSHGARGHPSGKGGNNKIRQKCGVPPFPLRVSSSDLLPLNISSTKSMTGHLLGATGALEAMFSIKSVQEDIIPPTINHEEGDDDENIDYNLNFTFNKAQKRTVRAALSNAFGFGGHNATVIVKKYVSHLFRKDLQNLRKSR